MPFTSSGETSVKPPRFKNSDMVGGAIAETDAEPSKGDVSLAISDVSTRPLIFVLVVASTALLRGQ